MSRTDMQMQNEIKILFGALCDGIRQEVRARRLAEMVSGQATSLADEREPGLASVLASHLRLVGFFIQVESYIIGGDPHRRPDLRVWLPGSRKYLYLELKTVGWGGDKFAYYYAGARNDMEKLKNDPSLLGKPNGLLVVGFGKTTDNKQQLLQGCQKNLSDRIAQDYQSYKKIGLEAIDLGGLDPNTLFAVVGLWVSMLTA